MPNLAALLKDEISRLARKEIRSQVGSTKQAVARYRREIAALKRQLQQQARKLAVLERRQGRGGSSPLSTDEATSSSLDNVRFSAKSVRSQRRRLGLSAENYGKLVGVSGLTIYYWEQGKTRPRQAQLASLAAVRGIGKKQALAKLAGM